MISRKFVCTLALIALLGAMPTPTFAQPESFRDVLQTTGVGPDTLAKLSDGPDYVDTDWEIILQVVNRLNQFRDSPPSVGSLAAIPDSWQVGDQRPLGELFDVRGTITSINKVALPDKYADIIDEPGIYRCTLQFADSSAPATILTTRIPNSWYTRQTLVEPVRLRGVLIQLRSTDDGVLPVLFTNHLAWFPTAGVPTGQLLLARAGMDVSLLDEVRHRQPFVKPAVSREGEAFYAALKALRQTDATELATFAQANVARAADASRSRQPELLHAHQQLEAKLQSASDDASRTDLQRQIKQSKQQRGLAAAVIDKAEGGQSSVATMFLQPELEVGQLYIIEGTARRAVRIAVDGDPALDHYFEVEVFTSDSQNLPVVCCVGQLPDGFPTGDKIREPVRLDGVFFKSWRYRSRDLTLAAGETARQRQLYTPVLIGKQPTWLDNAATRDSRWALWCGIAFLAVLAALWITLIRLARRDRRARAALRKSETINL